MILQDGRVIFKIKVQDTKSVQIDLGKKYDMKIGDSGLWTVVTDSIIRKPNYCAELPRQFGQGIIQASNYWLLMI